MLKPGASSSLGSNARNSLIVNFSNCCRVCDFGDILIFDAAAGGSGDVVGILPSSSSIDSASDDLDVGCKTAKAVQGAVILLLLIIILAVAANDIGGNDKGEKASTSVVVKSSSDDMS